MLASLLPAPLVDESLVYEPKYDGIRALVELDAGRAPHGVRIWSRLGNDKTEQFPEIVAALDRFRAGLKAGVLLDGEIVALETSGAPAGFQRLQGRIHLTGRIDRHQRAERQPTAFVAFDVLRDGGEDLRGLPLVARRARLERIFGTHGAGTLRLSELVAGDARGLHRRIASRGGEGLIAKRRDSPYVSGRRSADWRKIKLVQRGDFVVGGFTAQRGSRAHFGALLLGVRIGDALEYVGHTGTGFDDRELARLAAVLAPLVISTCPFRRRPVTNERPRWVKPEVVVEVRFSEWTDDRKLRAPVYLGQRVDVPAATAGASAVPAHRGQPPPGLPEELRRLFEALLEIETAGGDGVLTLPQGRRLEVTNLGKIWWREERITKGELMRYYVSVAPFLLPAVKDRPLIMKRFPNGVHAKAFYQQRAPSDAPAGVRAAALPSDRVVPTRLIGGSLITLLYMVQIAAISQDPWFSRLQSPDAADHVAFDLDPMPGVPFTRVLEVARWIHDELERLGVPAMAKTSGAEGLHIYLPLPPRTSYQAGRIFCEIIGTMVADKHPKVATVERAVHARGARVYIDCLQNIRGKSLATAYSARASAWAGVSAPLTWRDVEGGIDRQDFTIRTMPARLALTGDLWRGLREAKGADLRAVLKTPGV
jgi:bifunctional non-homologous end joining protein LigD